MIFSIEVIVYYQLCINSELKIRGGYRVTAFTRTRMWIEVGLWENMDVRRIKRITWQRRMLTCRRIKRVKRVESFLSFHISAELLGPVSANIKVYSGSLKVYGMEFWSYRCNGNETLLFTDVFFISQVTDIKTLARFQ